MNDANIKDNIITIKRLDLLFVSANKHRSNMKFETFLNLVRDIAIKKFYKFSESEAIIKLLQ